MNCISHVIYLLVINGGQNNHKGRMNIDTAYVAYWWFNGGQNNHKGWMNMYSIVNGSNIISSATSEHGWWSSPNDYEDRSDMVFAYPFPKLRCICYVLQIISISLVSLRSYPM
ncbi:hypothetical protein ACJX0J_017801, partial [Zea mays]